MLNLFSFFLICFVIVSCGSNKSDPVTSNPNQRSGRSNVSSDPKYKDYQPSISSDGTKLIYVSGKDETTLRVKKTSRTAGSAFATATKLSANSGLTIEQRAVLSPNGSYILIQGATATGPALVLCDWAAGNCTTVSATPWEDGEFGFSPESSAFYYLNGTSAKGATLTVASVTAPTTGYNVSTSDHWIHAFWLPVASGYTLFATERSDTVGKTNTLTFSFTTIASAATATGTKVLANLPYNSVIDRGPLGGSSGTTAASRILVAQWQKNVADKFVAEMGNAPVTADTQIKVPLNNIAYTYTVSGTDAAVLASTGYEMLSGYLASDSNTVFSLNRIAGRCDTEDKLTHGVALAVTNKTAGTTAWKLFKKPGDLSQPPVEATSFCDRTVGGVATTLDLGITSFVINASATAAAYTLVWSTDMTGDLEVFAMDVTASGSTITNVSNNRKP